MRPDSVLTSVGHSQGDGDHVSRLCPFNILFALPPEASKVQAPEYLELSISQTPPLYNDSQKGTPSKVPDWNGRVARPCLVG